MLGVTLLDSRQIPLVGASGAVAALIGAHIASVLLNWSEDSYAIVTTLRCCGKAIPIDQIVINGYREGCLYNALNMHNSIHYQTFCQDIEDCRVLILHRTTEYGSISLLQ